MTYSEKNDAAKLEAAFSDYPTEYLRFLGEISSRTCKRLDIYFNESYWRFVMCNEGCNGTADRVSLDNNGNTGLPEAPHEAFVRLAESIARRQHIGIVRNLSLNMDPAVVDLYVYFDAIEGRIAVSYKPRAAGFDAYGYWMALVLPASPAGRKTTIASQQLEMVFWRILDGWEASDKREPFQLDCAGVELSRPDQQLFFRDNNPDWWVSLSM